MPETNLCLILELGLQSSERSRASFRTKGCCCLKAVMRSTINLETLEMTERKAFRTTKFLNISLCVAQSLIDLLTIFSFWRDHLAFNKDFIIVLCL